MAHRLLSALLLTSSLIPSAAEATPFQSARIRRIVDGKEVFINRQPAQVNQQASKGQEVSTGRSRAELLFDRRALGFLGKNSLIQLGESCFRLQQGQVLINGPQNSCVGSKVLGVRGTTYVLSATDNNNYRLSVLAGEAIVSDQPLRNDLETEVDILKQYPRLNPQIAIGASTWGSNTGGKSIGQATGLILSDAAIFLPLHQSESKSFTYNYTATYTNLDGFWGASTEIGHKWFNPADSSVSTLTLGYNGSDSQSCYQSQISLGGLWEKNRWQLGLRSGIPLDGCPNSMSYIGSRAGLSIADLGDQAITLFLSPYVLLPNEQSYAGARIGIDVPLNKHLTASAYGQYDDLLDTVIGARVSYRFAPAGDFTSDPNLKTGGATSKAELQADNKKWQKIKALKVATNTDNKHSHSPGITPNIFTTERKAPAIILSGYTTNINATTGIISSPRKMTADEFFRLIINNFKGQNPLPEASIIAANFKNQNPDQVEKIKIVNTVTGSRFNSEATLNIMINQNSDFNQQLGTRGQPKNRRVKGEKRIDNSIEMNNSNNFNINIKR